jgi:hypothetical protein
MEACDNPFYDPAWEARVASAEARAMHAEIKAEAEAGRYGFGSGPHREALNAQAEAIDALKAARRARYKTISAYARAGFAAIEAPEDGFVMIPDFAAFVTLDEVDEAVARAARSARLGLVAENTVLATAQPPGLAAFSHPGRVVTSWRRFAAGRETIECLISFDDAGGDYHFCLAQAWGRLGPHSNDIFVRIATQLAREGVEFMRPGAAKLFVNDQHRMLSNIELIRDVNRLVGQFHFYRHMLADKGLREAFMRVNMRWDGACFVDPDWSGNVYASLPDVLRNSLSLPALPTPDKDLPAISG